MVFGRVVASVVQRQVKYVTPVPPGAATGLTAEIYGQIKDEMRIVVPPALLHSPAPEVLAAYWAILREPLLPTGYVGRAVKETVATAVSLANICPYCADMHSVGMYDLVGEADAEALAADHLAELSPGLREIALWASVSHERDNDLVRHPPFPAKHRPELVGVVVGIHYLVRMVNVFLSTFLLPPGLTPAARRRFKRGASRVLRPTLRDPREPGRSLPPLPAADLPADAAWALGNPHVVQAAARSYAVFDAAGERALSPVAREVVLERLESWRGEETGLDRGWCERLIAGLPKPDQAATRLALLTALASYQVDEHVISEFRMHFPGDRDLVETAAWASYSAARRVGSWHVANLAEPQSRSYDGPLEQASYLP